jgi:hypothetical protein
MIEIAAIIGLQVLISWYYTKPQIAVDLVGGAAYFLGAFEREFILELVELASRLGRDCNIW